MADGTFTIEVVGIQALTTAFRQYPAISAPILGRALSASGAVLAKNTTRDTVPWKTGFLTQSFQAVLEAGKLRWYPTASYARFVQFGTAPHLIEPKDKEALYWPGAQHPVRIVHHPGTKANDYMGRIIAASEEEINEQFAGALEKILEAIAKTSV